MRTVVFADSVIAQPTLEMLCRNGFVAGLCTSRRPSSAANFFHLAQATGLPLYQADRESLHDGLIAWLHELRPDVLLAFTFPYRLPAEVLSLPRFGGFNVHGGRLPQYRGPQPVFWQIANRESEGAVAVHRMDEKLDHGAVIVSQAVPIGQEETYGLHVVRLAFAAVPVAEALMAGLMRYGLNIPDMPQDESQAGFHARPTPNNLVIRWDEQSGDQICGLVKACNPWNQGAFTSIRGINLRLTDVSLRKGGGVIGTPPGVILSSDPQAGIIVNCLDGSALEVDVVSMDEGILPGRALAALGIQQGEQFDRPPLG